MIKFNVLIEDKLGLENLVNEHGLSLLINLGSKKILFDTGLSGAFIDNACRLGNSLKDIDYVILSHSHLDHTGGFKRYIDEFGKDFKLVIGNDFFLPKYKFDNNLYINETNPLSLLNN